MRRGRAVGVCGLAGLLAAAAGLAAADDPKPADAPPAAAPGDAVPAGFRSFVVTDDRFDKESVRNRTSRMHDLVVENALNPVCAVFTRTVPEKDDAPLARLAKQLQGVVAKYRAANAAAFVVFLRLDKEFPADDREGEVEGGKKGFIREKEADAVRALAAQLKTPLVPFGLAAGKPDEAGGPLAVWKIAEADDAVVVVYNRMRVVKRWAFTADTPPSDADIKAVVDAFEAQAKAG